MSVLLIAEHNNKNLKPFTLNAITAASKIDAEVHVLVAGSGCESVAKEVSEVPLVKKVLICDCVEFCASSNITILFCSVKPLI